MAVPVVVLQAMVVVGGVPTIASAMAAVGAVPTAKIDVSVVVIVAVVVPAVWSAIEPSVVATATAVPVVVLQAMVVVGSVPTMVLEMAAVSGLFRLDFVILYTNGLVASVDFCCCVISFDDVVAF